MDSSPFKSFSKLIKILNLRDGRRVLTDDVAIHGMQVVMDQKIGGKTLMKVPLLSLDSPVSLGSA